MRRKIFFRSLQRWRRRRGRPTPQRRNLIPRRYIAFFMAIVVVVVSIHSFYRLDRIILPLVLDAAELQLQAEINNIINAVVQDIIRQNNITAEDFIIQTAAGLAVNTVLANEICNLAAKSISARLNNLEPELVSVPMGMALGIDMLAQTGPQFSFYLAPIGNALVNYQSSFTAVGINQTHLSVWLTVESIVRIINPVHSKEIIVMRNVLLVDTVIQGTVPDAYLSMDVPGGWSR